MKSGFHSINGLARHLRRHRDVIEAVASTAGRYYKPFDRRRTAGNGQWRHIDRPCGELLDLQRQIHRRLLRDVLLPAQITGIRGRSTLDNAASHVDKRVVATLDLHNCYPEIDDLAVFEAWTRQLGLGHKVAGLLTQLTTLQHRLPQGAPTSPMLANLVLLAMYDEIVSLAEERGLDVSFYADDITVSGDDADKALGDIIDIVHAYRNRVSRRKIRVMRRNAGPQVVTGIVTNRKLSAGTNRIKTIREEIITLSSEQNISDRDLRRVQGMIADVRRICVSQADPLQRLADRCLPEVGTGSDRPRSDEVRRCTRTRRHRTRMS